ncbi:MAG: magnesium/cobalt transporter CorA [Anaerolineae bacterium]|nr:magnesium/cobalt transporter CorA [Anaerolineae bacterium]
MARSKKRRSAKVGLPPGTLVHVGEESAREVKITRIVYDEAHFEQDEVRTIDACLPSESGRAVTWIDVDGIHQIDILEQFGECLNVHPLVLEDVLNTEQRPKLDDYGEYLFVVLKMFRYDDHSGEMEAEQVSLILGANFVVSLQEKPGDVFDPIRERVRSGKGRMRKMGADYLAYALIDAVVDHYFVVLEQVGEKIELLEEELVTDPTPETLQVIHNLKRDMIFLRKSVWPLREVIGSLERGESSLIGESINVYLRDVYDHTIQVIDTLETFRDMISGMLDIYLSSISNRMNEVMKVLTIIATTFIPLTLIAGVYGMNFRYMPELEWPWGYPMVWLVMLGVVVVMLVYFRKKKWF